MRKSIWILALGLILAIGVPSAWADSFTPTFTCTSCAELPTAGAVSFPSPSILEMWDTSFANVQDSITLASIDNPGDVYTWSNVIFPNGVSESGVYVLSITDVTTADLEVVMGSVGISGDPLLITSVEDDGTLTFQPMNSAVVPEPSTISLILIGIASLLILVRWKAQHSGLA